MTCRRHTTPLLLAIALLAGAMITIAAETAEAGNRPRLPGMTVPQGLGFNIHIRGPESDWDLMQQAGVRYIRADYGWNGVEKVKGEYNFAAYDKLLDELAQRSIRAIFILDYRNRNYPKPETTEEGREAYARWAAASAKHFKGRSIIWEIWNEPNVGFWKGEGKMNSREYARQYIALVKKTVPAMRAEDPMCLILGGSVSCLWKDSFVWIDEVLKQGLLDTGIDALSVHPYGFKRPELCISQSEPGGKDVNSYDYLRKQLAKYGKPDFPVTNTEVGYPTKKDNTLEMQAWLFVRTYLIDQMCGIPTTIWYNWDERDAAKHRVRSEPGAEPLPVYNACKNMTAELDGYQFEQRLKTASPLDYVLQFKNNGGRRKVVAWTVPETRGASQENAKAHEVTITLSPQAVVRDLYGKPIDANKTGNKVTVTLTGSPIYIDSVFGQ